MSDKRSNIPTDVLDAYDRVVSTVPAAARKGATMPYTSINGNMSSFLSPDGILALRLSAVDRATFMSQFGASLHEAHGRTMAEYVSVPASLLGNTAELAPWFAASWGYVGSLKPKPTTRNG